MGLGTTVDRWPTRHDLWHHVKILFTINYKKVKSREKNEIMWHFLKDINLKNHQMKIINFPDLVEGTSNVSCIIPLVTRPLQWELYFNFLVLSHIIGL